MADDERFDADGFDGDADTGHGPVGSGDEHDAALDGSDAQPVSPAGAGADADPAASELSAIFAAALADEPLSRVTAESVLREVRGQKRSAQGGFGRWLVSGRAPAKWAGGLVAVAALVAAVIVVAPNTGSSPNSASTAASGMYESSGASEGSAAAEERAAAADSTAGAPEAPGLSEMSSSSESSEAAPDVGAYTALSGSADSDVSDAGGSGERPSAATGSASAGDNAAQSCSLPSLTPEEWSAAAAALPADVTKTRLPGHGCQAGALRGSGIEVARGGEQAGTFLWIVVSHGEIGRDGAATDSTVVSASRGDVTVTVIANQSGDPWLDEAALHELVDAVAAAS